jgi:hypothetical protein
VNVSVGVKVCVGVKDGVNVGVSRLGLGVVVGVLLSAGTVPDGVGVKEGVAEIVRSGVAVNSVPVGVGVSLGAMEVAHSAAT